MNYDLILTLITNTLILVSMSIIYSMFPSESKIPPYLKRIIIGIYISVIGIVIMSIPFDFQDGVFFDTRSILISSSGMFLGFIPTLISGIVLLAYRLYLGGEGAITGVLVIFSSASIGLLWRRYRLKSPKNYTINNYELFFVGFIVHLVMLLLMLNLPSPTREHIIKRLWSAILFLYPLGGYLVYQFHMAQRIDFFQKIRTRKSELQYRNLFEKSKVILLLMDYNTGKIVDANQTALDFYGWSLEEMKNLFIHDINTLSRLEVQQEMANLRLHGKNHFTFKHQTADSSIIDVEVYSGPITIDEKDYILSTIHDITDKKLKENEINRKQEELKYISHHDFLTGLYNRYFFEVELSRLNTKRQLPLSIIMGDVNGLKLVNDAFSHLEGDELLKEIAKIIKKSVRSEDIVARWGGDEFVILLPKTDSEITAKICDRITSLCQTSSYKRIKPNISLGSSTKTEKNEDIYNVLKKAEEIMYRNKLLQGKSMRNSLISTLESTLVEKSFETKDHAQNMIDLSKQFAKKINLSEDDVNTVTLIARLHDIGKISISDSILRKSGPLDNYEWKKIKDHPNAGGRIVSSIPELKHIAEGIIHHHEKFDGTGYPYGLAAENIPYFSRIISIVDAYEVMTSGRIYKKAISHDQALNELELNKHTQFDPELVDTFKTIF